MGKHYTTYILRLKRKKICEEERDHVY